ncbi:LVIVD repeat-containing protein [Humibacillus xanthopallidus]|uniref:LVIVD repeat-containing protein n=1 Tax=Humibacillus xanthopallidus TaxID=412689 RepID=UPI00384C6AA6
MRQLRALVAVAAASVAMATALPAAAHEPWDDGSIPPPPPASAADGYSKDMHLLSTSAHTGGVNSDLAFKGSLVFAGHYGGFRVIDLAEPGSPVELADVHCNGPQGDVTIHGDLLFLSVDTPQSTEACEGSRNVTASTPGAFEGIRVFDISDPADPTFVKAVRTDCGSHTNTLVPGEGDTAYVYVASYPLSASNIGPDCQAPFERISVIQVDGDDAAAGAGARVVAEPTIKGVDYFGAAYGVTPFYACHDITVLSPKKIAAAACLSQGQLWDISNPLQPVVTADIDTTGVDIWHSAAFTPDGKYVTFGDEYFGPAKEPFGALWTYAVADPSTAISHYRIPRSEPNTYHNFNYVPLADRYVLVSSAYGSGTSVVDLTDPAAPKEIAFYDMRSNQWSTYFYNGLIVANDISRGVDTLRLSNKAVAGAKKLPMLNPQTQEYLIG